MFEVVRLRLRNPSLFLAALAFVGLAPPQVQAQDRAPSRVAAATLASTAPTLIRGSSLPHTVRPGDTLQGVCRQYDIAPGSCPQVAYFNQLENNQLPAPGSTVYVPLGLLPFKPLQARLIQTAGNVQINGQSVRAGVRLDENTRVTAETDSSAVVELADGSQVKVLPSSVADIVHSRHYTAPDETSGGKVMQWVGSKIRVVQGAIESAVKKKSPTDKSASKPVEVETVTSLIGVRGTEFRVAAADKYVPFDRAEVLDGSVSNINTWKHSEIILNAGQGAVVDPNKADMQMAALLPAPAVPEKGQILRRPRANWIFSPVPGAVAYRVMAASDAAFNTIRYSEKTITPQADLGRLENGIWHVRARAVDAHGLEGQDATSTIDLRQPAWILLGLSAQPVQERMHLVWSATTNADREPLLGVSTVTIDLARDKDFAKPLASLKTSGNQVQLPGLGPGKYFLRVSVENDTIKNDEQQFFLFEIPVSTRNMGYNLLLQSLS